MEEVYGNRALKTAGMNGSQRPDIIAKNADGKTTIIEYASPSQAKGTKEFEKLLKKIDDMQDSNPDTTIVLHEWGSY